MLSALDASLRSALDRDMEQAVLTAAICQMEKLKFHLVHGPALHGFEDCRKVVRACRTDVGLTSSLAMDQQYCLAELLEDEELDVGDGSWNSLRRRIEYLAAQAVQRLGVQQAFAAVDEVERMVRDLGLNFSALCGRNPYRNIPPDGMC